MFRFLNADALKKTIFKRFTEKQLIFLHNNLRFWLSTNSSHPTASPGDKRCLLLIYRCLKKKAGYTILELFKVRKLGSNF